MQIVRAVQQQHNSTAAAATASTSIHNKSLAKWCYGHQPTAYVMMPPDVHFANGQATLKSAGSSGLANALAGATSGPQPTSPFVAPGG